MFFFWNFEINKSYKIDSIANPHLHICWFKFLHETWTPYLFERKALTNKWNNNNDTSETGDRIKKCPLEKHNDHQKLHSSTKRIINTHRLKCRITVQMPFKWCWISMSRIIQQHTRSIIKRTPETHTLTPRCVLIYPVMMLLHDRFGLLSIKLIPLEILGSVFEHTGI